jgi:YegS/Rv2252/BmrU family lipid kinase
MAAERRYLLLVNPSAGGGRAGKLRAPVELALERRGIEFEAIVTESLDDGVEKAEAAAARGEIPVVMSGDGLIGQIGGALAGTETPIGVIPGGRGNDLARVLGIPTEVDRAADVIAAGNVREIDVAEVNGHPYLCIASCGFDSVANRIANEAKLVRGNLVYAYAAIRTLIEWKPASFEVSVDGEKHRFSGYSVAVANSRAYGGGMFVAPDAELDDGRLEVVNAGAVGKLRFLANLPKVFKGTHIGEDEVSLYRGARVEIRADRPFAVYADGEHATDLPATIRVRPGRLGVIAPPGPLRDPDDDPKA